MEAVPVGRKDRVSVARRLFESVDLALRVADDVAGESDVEMVGSEVGESDIESDVVPVTRTHTHVSLALNVVDDDGEEEDDAEAAETDAELVVDQDAEGAETDAVRATDRDADGSVAVPEPLATRPRVTVGDGDNVDENRSDRVSVRWDDMVRGTDRDGVGPAREEAVTVAVSDWEAAEEKVKLPLMLDRVPFDRARAPTTT